MTHKVERARLTHASVAALKIAMPDPPGGPNGNRQAQDGWPEPLDMIGSPDLVGWPEIIPECLPVPLHHYVEAEAERMTVDPCPLAVHIIAACSASISDAWRVKPKRHDRWTQQPRIWSCVVKDVGQRGTEMIRSAFRPVKEIEDGLYAQYRQEHTTWEKRRARRKKGEDDPTDVEPRCRRLTTNDATIEAVSEILSKGDGNTKIVMFCDELVSFLGNSNRYTPNGAAGRALWLESYDGGPQRIDRIKRGCIYVPNWSVVVAGNIQPRRLAGMAKDLIDDGLFQRFLTVHTRPASLGLDDDLPQQIDADLHYRDLHRALAELQPPPSADLADPEPMPAFFDDEARAVRREFMPLIERLRVDPTFPTIISETAPKWSGTLARLSLIFHLVKLAERVRQGEHPRPCELAQVSGPTVTMAATFLRRIALPNLFRLGHETMPDEGAPVAHARWLAGHMLAHKSDSITARDIGRSYRNLRGKLQEIDQAMAILCDASWVRSAGMRSDSKRWEVNPAVHQVFAAAAKAEKERRERVKDVVRSNVADL